MKDPVTITKIVEGECPYCGHKGNYAEPATFEDDMVCYPYLCEKCGRYYEEWYLLQFTGMNVGTRGYYVIDETGDIDPVIFDYNE